MLPFRLKSGYGLFIRSSSTLYRLKCRHSSTLAPALPQPVQLRPYQEHCLKACLDAINETSYSRIGISLPTGSGKTTVFVSLISRLNPPREAPEATQALVIVNAIQLAQQCAEQVKRMFPSMSVEIDQGAMFKASGTADV